MFTRRHLTSMVNLATLTTMLITSSVGTAADEPEDVPNRSAEQSRRLAGVINQLIQQLDDVSFETREEASGELAEIGKLALGALQEATKSSSAEVRFRARALVEVIKRFKLYTLSCDGRLFRIDVGKNHMKTSLIAKLGQPFENADVHVEGLAMAPDGVLYASAVRHSKEGRQSCLYRINAQSGVVTSIGKIAAAEIDGLDFGADGKLYGAISSGSKARAVGLRQIVSIDTATGKASSTATEITFGDVDALACAHTGKLFLTNGSNGLFSVDPTRKNESVGVITNRAFQSFLCANDEMEGMCITSDGAIFGLCHETRTFLVRLEPETGRVTKLGDLGFAALCLAADKSMENTKNESDE